jgi:peroxiredoxin
MQVIGISQDEARDTESFNQRYGVTFPTVLDRRADGYAVSNAYGITNVPSLFLVEPDGQISMAGSGFAKRDIEALAARVGVAVFNPGERAPEFKPG